MRHYITFAPEDDSSWALSYDIMPTVSVIHGMDESPQDALGSFSEYGAVRSNEDLLSALISLPSKYGVEDWDGNGAAPLSEHSFSSAVYLARRLPPSFPAPRVVVDPDGDVCFKWERSRNTRLELTISSANTYYALVVYKGMKKIVSSTSCGEVALNAERVLGWR